MRRVVLDTNVLISFLTDRDAEQQAAAAALFEAAVEGEIELVLHQMVIGEMVYVLANLYRIEPAAIAGMLADLLAMPGLRPVDEVVWTRVLELWPETYPDFADAVLATVARQQGFRVVATFDQAFVKRLRRQGSSSYWDADEPEGSESSDSHELG